MMLFRGHAQVGLLRVLASEGNASLTATAVAIGNFDGVHRGHRVLIDRARSHAAALGGKAAVLTFDPHPAAVLAPELAPSLLTPLGRKLELLAAAGLDACVVEPFDRQLAELSPGEFARVILADGLGARHVVVGYDFTFGHKRAGTTELLGELGDELGFRVDVVQPVAVDGQVASSTCVRRRIAEGDLGGARLLLGRSYDVDGVVVRGAGRGRGLGIPTANVRADAQLLPATGIYAVWLTVLDGADSHAPVRRAGAASLGTNPTFAGAAELTLEVHLLDFDGDLYGRRVRVAFVEHLRGELRFDGPTELVAQIQRDITDTRRILAGDE